MKRFILSALAVFLFSGISQAQTVADYVKFEQAKRATYAHAFNAHKVSKKKVVVWVNHEDIKAWMDTKDDYIHCFVKSFDFTDRGVVVGGEVDGQFVKLKVIGVDNLSAKIRDCNCQHCECNPCKCNHDPVTNVTAVPVFDHPIVPTQTNFSFQPTQVYPICVDGNCSQSR